MYYKKEGRMRQALVKHVLDLGNQMGNISERGSVEEAESYRGKPRIFSGIGLCCSSNLTKYIAGLPNNDPLHRRSKSINVFELSRLEAIDYQNIEEFAIETRFLSAAAKFEDQKKQLKDFKHQQLHAVTLKEKPKAPEPVAADCAAGENQEDLAKNDEAKLIQPSVDAGEKPEGLDSTQKVDDGSFERNNNEE